MDILVSRGGGGGYGFLATHAAPGTREVTKRVTHPMPARPNAVLGLPASRYQSSAYRIVSLCSEGVQGGEESP